MSAGPATSPTLVGVVTTSRGKAAVSAHRGAGVVTIGLANGLLSATVAAHDAVTLAAQLLDAARIALGQPQGAYRVVAKGGAS